MARVLLKDWVNDGWLEVASASKRTRSYSLSAIHQQFIGNDLVNSDQGSGSIGNHYGFVGQYVDLDAQGSYQRQGDAFPSRRGKAGYGFINPWAG
jgi:hypothetical protein